MKKDIEAITQVAADWRKGWRKGDTDLLMSLYSRAPVLLPQGRPPVVGRRAIRALYEPLLRSFAFTSESRLMEVSQSGDLGYFWSTYELVATPREGGNSMRAQGKSVFIVKREGGSWKIARLIDNSNQQAS